MDFQKLELLAPVGKWEALEQVAAAGADAVYLGGKGFNMRMLRPEFNFREEEIKAATAWLHENNKKIYITINSLYNEQEIEQIKEYLFNLDYFGVDGFIVQDMGIVTICQEMGLTTPLHASVQMGIANLPAVRYLEEMNFTRAILSKDLSLEEIGAIHRETAMEIEFFIHGDLCLSHTGQCHLSSFMAGQSSNRGRCIKPCRWQYALAPGGDYQYRLASNDLCLYQYLPALIAAGVVSFKIEGRMRDSKYISHLVKTYRQALDRIISDQEGYELDPEGMAALEENKIRHFTAGSIGKTLREDHVDITGSREPAFISQAVDLPRLVFTEPLAAKDGKIDLISPEGIQELSVKVNTYAGAVAAVKNGADKLIIGSEEYRQQDDGNSGDRLQEIIDWARGEKVPVWLETPRIAAQKDIDRISSAISKYAGNGIAGMVFNDYGSFHLFKNEGWPMMGGTGLNITNHLAASLAASQGMTRTTASPELDIDSLTSLLQKEAEVEVMVQGPLCGFITDYCFIDSEGSHCGIKCTAAPYQLRDKKGQAYFVRTDHDCRNYVYYPFDLCLYNYLSLLSSNGLRYIRIDGHLYEPELLGQVTAIYRRAIDRVNKHQPLDAKDYKTIIDLFPGGLTALPAEF